MKTVLLVGLAAYLTLVVVSAQGLSEVQTLKGRLYVQSREAFSARLEKAQNDAKKQAEQQLQQTLQRINQAFQAELLTLETDRQALDADYRLTLKCDADDTVDLVKGVCVQPKKPTKKEP